jgi:hypothetical protein
MRAALPRCIFPSHFPFNITQQTKLNLQCPLGNYFSLKMGIIRISKTSTIQLISAWCYHPQTALTLSHIGGEYFEIHLTILIFSFD